MRGCATPQRNPGVLIGELAILGSSFVWAIGGVLLSRINRKVNLMTAGASRTLSASIFFFILLQFYGGFRALSIVRPRDILGLTLSFVIVLGIGDTLFFLAIKKIGMVRAMPLAMTFPLATFALSAIFLGEHISLLVVLGAGFILAGVYFLSSSERAALPATKPSALGIALALATALCWAVGTVVLTPASEHVGPIVGNFVRQLGAAVLFLVVMPKAEGLRQLRSLTPQELVVMIVAGTVAYGFGSFLYMFALQRIGASITSVLSATTPLFSTPLSIVLLGEKANRRALSGTVLVVAGVSLVLLG